MTTKCDKNNLFIKNKDINVYGDGIKQLVAHTIGISNEIMKSNYINKKIYFLEIVYDFKDDFLKFKNYIECAIKMIDLLKENPNNNKLINNNKIKLLYIQKYQDIFKYYKNKKILNSIIKKYYKFD